MSCDDVPTAGGDEHLPGGLSGARSDRFHPPGRVVGRVDAHPGGMDIAAITSLNTAWRAAATSRRATAVLDELLAREPVLRAIQPGSFSAIYAAATEGNSPWLVTEALVRQFWLDELVGLGLLNHLRRGMVQLARRFDWGLDAPWNSTDVLGTEIVSRTWRALAGAGGTTVAFPERTILERVRKSLDEERRTDRRRRAYCATATRVEDAADPTPRPLLEELAFGLRHCAPELSRADRALLYAHRVAGFTFPEIAQAWGVQAATLQQRSHRAEERLAQLGTIANDDYR